jgi:hypothetical protein
VIASDNEASFAKQEQQVPERGELQIPIAYVRRDVKDKGAKRRISWREAPQRVGRESPLSGSGRVSTGTVSKVAWHRAMEASKGLETNGQPGIQVGQVGLVTFIDSFDCTASLGLGC